MKATYLIMVAGFLGSWQASLAEEIDSLEKFRRMAQESLGMRDIQENFKKVLSLEEGDWSIVRWAGMSLYTIVDYGFQCANPRCEIPWKAKVKAIGDRIAISEIETTYLTLWGEYHIKEGVKLSGKNIPCFLDKEDRVKLVDEPVLSYDEDYGWTKLELSLQGPANYLPVSVHWEGKEKPESLTPHAFCDNKSSGYIRLNPSCVHLNYDRLEWKEGRSSAP